MGRCTRVAQILIFIGTKCKRDYFVFYFNFYLKIKIFLVQLKFATFQFAKRQIIEVIIETIKFAVNCAMHY